MLNSLKQKHAEGVTFAGGPDGDLVDSYRREELNLRNLIDFLPRINPKSETDTETLRRWTAYFRSVRVPYIVTRINGKLKLWKEARI